MRWRKKTGPRSQKIAAKRTRGLHETRDFTIIARQDRTTHGNLTALLKDRG